MDSLPTNIQIASARLPATYEQAKVALSSCQKIDECKTWADKAEALASYAKMADDDSLRKMSDRIQARAINRMGVLLKEFSAQGKRTDQLTEAAHGKLSQREAAEAAGISEHQQLQAVRVANVPDAEFEAAVESENPTTVTALAEMGKKTVSKRGRVGDPYAKCMRDVRADVQTAVSALSGNDNAERREQLFAALFQLLEYLQHLASKPEAAA
jgi:hypothetical protein